MRNGGTCFGLRLGGPARRRGYQEASRVIALLIFGAAVGVACSLFCSGALAQSSPSNAGASPGTYKIAGVVVNGMTGSALAQARVALVDTRSRRQAATVVSGEDGHFEFASLPAGKYGLMGTKAGFLTQFYEQHEQFNTAIVTGPEMKTDALVLRLTPMAVISGHVTDEHGEAVRKATVSLYLDDNSGGTTRTMGVGATTTDDVGYYDFSEIQPGKFFIAVSAMPWYAVHPSMALQEVTGGSVSPALDVAYPTTYFGGATEAEGASAIVIQGGERVQADITMEAVPALHIIFHAPANQDAGAFQPPALQKRVFDSLEGVPQGGMNQVEPGVYELTGVPAGRYTVQTSNGGEGEPGQSADVNLTSGLHEIDGLHGEPLASLKLTVKVPGEEATPKQMFLALQDSHLRTIAYSPLDGEGKAAFDALAAGKYTIVCYGLGRRYAVAKIALASGAGTTEIAGHEVSVTAGSTQELAVSLAAGVVNVEGVVQKGGKPVAGVMVVLIPKDPLAHNDLFRRDQSDFDGTFAVGGVIPGSYTIVAVEDAWGFEWLKPGVLSRYAEHGQKLEIGPLMQRTVVLPDAVEVQGR
jgi:Carboxypeptidase regulatory-like domain